jgi:hypothetical protein
MYRSLAVVALALAGCVSTVRSFSMEMSGAPSRRAFLSQTVSTTAAVVAAATLDSKVAEAAPEILNTSKGIKYAVLKQPKDSKAGYPQSKDIVAIEYTG